MPPLHKLLPDGRVKVLSEDGNISYIDKSGNVSADNIGPESSASTASPTLAEKASKFIMGGYPLARPALLNPEARALPFDRPIAAQLSQYVQSGALNPLNALEGAGRRIGDVEQGFIDRSMTSPSKVNSPLGLGIKAAIGTGASLLTSAGEPTPTNAATSAGMGLAFGMAGAGAHPILRSPLDFHQGAESAIRSLGDQSLSPEAAGRTVRQAYNARVATPFAMETTQPPAGAPYQAKSGPEIFNPKYQEVAGKFSPEAVSYEQAGKDVKGTYQKNIEKLQSVEKQKWGSLSTEHFEKPAVKDDLQEFVDSVLNMQGQTSAIDRLNPTLREAALKSQNPEAMARSVLQYGQQSKAPGGFTDQNVPASEAPDARAGHIENGYGIFNKIAKILEGPLNVGQLKSLRTEIGNAISSWGGRGDQLDGLLKQGYKAATSSLYKSAENGGFLNDFKDALQSSKDLFAYSDLPSAKIIGKSQYLGDIINRVIKSNSPERVTELFDKHNLSQRQRSDIGRAILDRISEQSGGDPKKFLAAYDKLGTTKQALFGKNLDLVESIRDTVKVLNDEIAKAKQKPKAGVLGTMPILSKTGLRLDAIMSRSEPSELVSKLLHDGTPEMARTVSGAVGQDAMAVLRRAAVNELTSPAEIPTKGLDPNQIGSALQRLNPEFIKEFFGNDAPLVQALRDSYRYAGESAPSLFPVSASHGIRYANLLSRLWQKYRLTGNVETMLRRTAGAELANKIIPQIKPSIPRPSLATPYGDAALYPAVNPRNEK